jgi:hypothetical protein
MRSGFLKAGSNTTLLAQQTQYLNTEQLEAATVAASLNQAHTRLTQSFVVETTAVRLLRQAYIDATIAATNFARANPGMMMPGFKPGIKGGGTGKKFASGTTEVVGGTPGKDSVPALVMPGEAIVPTKIAQDNRFKPLIEALVTGKIAQYGSGTVGVNVAPPPSGSTGFVYNNELFPTSTNNAKKISQELNRRLATDPNFKIDTVLNRARDLLDPTRPGSKRPNEAPKPITTTALRNYLKPQTRGGNEANPAIGTQRRNLPYVNPITGEVITNIDKNQKTRIMSDLNESLIKAGLSQKEARNFINLNESHLNKASRSDLKWFDGHVVQDIKGLNNYLNRIDPNRVKGGGASSFDKIIKEIEKNPKQYGFDKKYLNQIKKDIGFFKTGAHPFFPEDLKKLERIYGFDIEVNKNKKLLDNAKVSKGFRRGVYQAKGVKLIQEARKQFGNKFYDKAQILRLGGDKSNPTAFAVTPGEVVEYNKKKAKQVTPSTGKPVGNTKVVGGGPTDTRLISGKGVKKIIPNKFGFKGPGSFALGAMGGYDAASKVSTPGSGFKSGAIAPNMRVSQSQIQDLVNSLDKNTTSQNDGTETTTKSSKELKQAARAQRAQRVGAIAGPAAGALGMASMGAFMTGNSGMGMGLMGASAVASILPMLTNPINAVVAALVASVASVYFWNKSLEKSAKKQAEFVAATSATTQKMSDVGKITGAVGASEIMTRRRQSGSFGAYNDAQRAGSMFGDTFLQSDIGKTMVKGFVENMEKFGSKQAASDFALQLSTYVSDGVLTADQAAGIAEQIGIQLGNQRYTVQIQGDLRSIIGPNGENLAKDPLRVRTQIITQATKRTERELDKLAEAQASGTSGRNEAARIAAIAGNNLEIIKAQADATQVMYSEQINVLQKELERTTNLEKQLELKQKIATLESQQAKDVGTFNLAFSNQIDKELKTFNEKIQEDQTIAINNNLFNAEDAYFDSLKSTVKDTFKGTAYESLATDALSRLAKLSDRQTFKPFGKTKGGFETAKEAQTFEVQMSLLMKNKVINPEQSNALLDMFAGKLPELQNTLSLGIKTQGAEKTVAMLDFFMGLDLEKENPATLSARIVKSDPATFDKIGEALAALQVLDGHEVNMSAYIDVVGYDGLVALANKLAIVEKIPTPITKESILKFYEEGGLVGTGVTKSQLELLMSKWQDFDALPDSLQKEAISKFLTIYETKFADPESKIEYMRQEAARIATAGGGSAITQDAEFRRLMSLVGTDPTRLSSEFVAAQTRSYIGDAKKDGTGKLGGGGVVEQEKKILLLKIY